MFLSRPCPGISYRGFFDAFQRLIHVTNLERALAFFTETLGFETLDRAANHTDVHRETAGGFPGSWSKPVRTQLALHAELKPKLDALPKGDVHGLVN